MAALAAEMLEDIDKEIVRNRPIAPDVA